VGGDRVALVCKDSFGNVKGLFVADRDGTDLVPIVEDQTAIQGPTWAGRNTIYYISAQNDESTWLMRVGAEEGAVPERIEGLESGWLSDPDASEFGVLYLRSAGKNKPGNVYRLNLNTQSKEERLTTDGNAMSPTWSPDGRYFAFLAPDSEDPAQLSIWVQEATGTAQPTEIRVDGVPGPPAWGAR
jgi:Tol biopolymer transport system component